jgi:hypothetical protein
MSGVIITLFALGTALVLVQVTLDDAIIRHVCRREGKSYSLLWPFSPYWQSRILGWEWWQEARAAGLYRLRMGVFSAFLGCIGVTFLSVVMSRPA